MFLSDSTFASDSKDDTHSFRLSRQQLAAASNLHHPPLHVAGRRDADMQSLHSVHGTPSSFSRLCTSFQKSSMSFGAESKAYHVIRFRRLRWSYPLLLRNDLCAGPLPTGGKWALSYPRIRSPPGLCRVNE